MYSLYWLRRSRTSSLRRSSTASSSEMTSAIFSATRSGFDVSMVPGVRLLTSCLEMYATNSLASSMLCARIRSLSRMGYESRVLAVECGGMPVEGDGAWAKLVRMTSLIYNYLRDGMIRNYGDEDTERFAAGGKVRQWEPFRQQAEKRLRILDAATSLGDLATLNSDRLEGLKGSRKGRSEERRVGK